MRFTVTKTPGQNHWGNVTLIDPDNDRRFDARIFKNSETEFRIGTTWYESVLIDGMAIGTGQTFELADLAVGDIPTFINQASRQIANLATESNDGN